MARVDLFNHDKGIGDTFSRAISSLTGGRIKECGGCQKRKEYLNKKIPYRNPNTKKYE